MGIRGNCSGGDSSGGVPHEMFINVELMLPQLAPGHLILWSSATQDRHWFGHRLHTSCDGGGHICCALACGRSKSASRDTTTPTPTRPSLDTTRLPPGRCCPGAEGSTQAGRRHRALRKARAQTARLGRPPSSRSALILCLFISFVHRNFPRSWTEIRHEPIRQRPCADRG